MMRLFVPRCGDYLRVTSDWGFTLYCEPRNDALVKILLGVTHTNYSHYCERDDDDGMKTWPQVIPAGTILRVDRVYIRNTKGFGAESSEYDSMTFKVMECKPNLALEKARFWAKIDDCNLLECDPCTFSFPVKPAQTKKKITAQDIRENLSNILKESDLQPLATMLAKYNVTPRQLWKEISYGYGYPLFVSGRFDKATKTRIRTFSFTPRFNTSPGYVAGGWTNGGWINVTIYIDVHVDESSDHTVSKIVARDT